MNYLFKYAITSEERCNGYNSIFFLFNHALVTVGKDVVSQLKSYMIRFCNNVKKKMLFWIYSFLSRSIAGKTIKIPGIKKSYKRV